jgi:trehalose synthase
MPTSSRTHGRRPPVARRAPRRPGVAEVPLEERPFELLATELTPAAWDRLSAARARARRLLAGRAVWSINSTARGGGVAELLRTLVPYWRGDGIDARWLVMEAGPSFFRLTKRIHNMLHGVGAGEPPLGPAERRLYERVSRAVAAAVAPSVAPGDVVLLQDPQTAGLAPLLKSTGAVLVWRCHVGADTPSAPARDAWAFLLPYIDEAHLQVFSRSAFVPEALDRGRVRVFPPGIDPCSPKNQPLAPEAADAILAHCGLTAGPRSAPPSLRTVDLSEGGSLLVRRRCRILREGRPPRPGGEKLVVALSRWDRLKDPVGIARAFARHVREPHARLILGGAAGTYVADDPEGAPVQREVRDAWAALPPDQRARIDMAVLPTADLDENALIVNALQSRADVVVKKSLQEGFGLGVTEALWKARPVVATRVGGQQEQIDHRRTGLLVDDPADLRAFGGAVDELLRRPALGLELGAAGRRDVQRRFLADRHFEGWAAAMGAALAEAGA